MKSFKSITILISILFPIGCFLSSIQTCFAQSDINNSSIEVSEEDEYLEGKVIEIIEERDIEFVEQTQKYQKLRVNITKGSLKGDDIIIENGITPMSQVILYSAEMS